MLARALCLLAALALVAAQAEQSIFAQFLYPPVAVAKPLPKAAAKQAMQTQPTTQESLEVLPLLARAKRSGFNKESAVGGNDVVFNQFRSKMADPGWTPDVFPRFGGEQSSEHK